MRGGQYAIALARIDDGRVTLGVLGCPNLHPSAQPDAGAGALLVAKRGAGAYVMPLDGEAPQPIRVSEQNAVSQARLLRSVESGHTNVDQTGAIATMLGVEADPVALDSQAKYAVLASGHAEILLRLLSPKRPDYREMIWDQAAGSIVLEEAGGRITDLDGKPLDFSHGRRLEANRGIFASNGHLHEVGLEAIRGVQA